jgi:hypothetical protein
LAPRLTQSGPALLYRRAIACDQRWTGTIISGNVDSLPVEDLLAFLNAKERQYPDLQPLLEPTRSGRAAQHQQQQQQRQQGQTATVPPRVNICFPCAAGSIRECGGAGWLQHLTKEEWTAQHGGTAHTCSRCGEAGHHGNVCYRGKPPPTKQNTRRANAAARKAAAQAENDRIQAAMIAAWKRTEDKRKAAKAKRAGSDEEDNKSDSEYSSRNDFIAALFASSLQPTAKAKPRVIEMYADSGCNHMLATPDLVPYFQDARPSTAEVVTAGADADGSPQTLQCVADGALPMRIGDTTVIVPATAGPTNHNLLSISQLDDQDFVCCFGQRKFFLFRPDPKRDFALPGSPRTYRLVTSAPSKDGMYPVFTT